VTASGRIIAAPEMADPGDGTGGCAERTAILRAVLARQRRAVELHLAGDAGGRNDAGPPCGRCLQILFEFSPGLRVYWGTPARPEGGWTVRELLPGAFGPRSLAAAAARRRGVRRTP
jgi:cytidine deaminase